jgi:hypothetical protein
MQIVQKAVFCTSSQLCMLTASTVTTLTSLNILKCAKSLACMNVDISFEMMQGCSFILCMWTSLYLEYNDFP